MKFTQPLIGGVFSARTTAAQQLRSWLDQAVALQQGGQWSESAAVCERVLQQQPRSIDALHLAGVAHVQLRDHRKAVDLFTRALKVNRNSASLYNNRGAAYAALEEFDRAVSNYNHAIELEPDFEQAYNNRGNVLLRLGRHQEAIRDYEKAIALEPDYFEAHNNLANALSEVRRYEEARDSYQRAVVLKPASAELRWNLGMCCLRMGDFERGWSFNEWRLTYWREKGWTGGHAQPRWTGTEPLEGRTILLHAEQGLGDTLQFARYAPLVSRLGARVLLEVQEPLAPLLANADLPGVEVVARGASLPSFDTHCPLLSLPRAFQTDLGNVPPPLRLAPDMPRRQHWHARLGQDGRPRIGLAWRGNPAHVDDHKRSMALQQLTTLLTEDARWISLHKDIAPADRPALEGSRLVHFDDQSDFLDAAALCSLVDVVVSVDTSLAHLAASLGKPVWLLLSHNADWRWLTDRQDSPWYPTVKLYRQAAPGQWEDVLADVKRDIALWQASPAECTTRL